MYCPPEIISAILCYQSKIELKKTRLVCKTFSELAVPFLFDEIFVTARYADIERATLLASRFGPFVKTLIFCSEHFDPTTTFETFTNAISDRDLARSYYTSFCNLRQEQKELLSEGEFFGHLCSTLIVLINLHKVILTNVCRTQGLCWCEQAYVDGCFRTFKPWSHEHHPALKSLVPAYNHECRDPTNGLEERDSNVWPELLRALFTSGNTKVKTIVTEGGNFGSGLVITAFCMTPRQRFCAAQVLPNLTSLHLDLDLDSEDGAGDDICSERTVTQTLSAAINLESLMIDIVAIGPNYWEDEQLFETILGGCKMPKLMKLGLRWFTITEAGMTTFLQDSQRIRRMSLHDVTMTSGSWENMLETIKISLPLESFDSGPIFGGVPKVSQEYKVGPAIEEFLFSDGPNPFSSAALEEEAKRTGT